MTPSSLRCSDIGSWISTIHMVQYIRNYHEGAQSRVYYRDGCICIGHISFPRIDLYISFGVAIDWNGSKVATCLWNSFRFLDAPFPCLSKKPASCNPNEGGDSELLKYGVQTK